MGTILLALLQLSAGAGLDQAKAAYQTCVTSEAVRLGSGNQETADTILRAVRSKCDPAWQQLVTSFPDAGGIPIAVQARSRALTKWRTDAEDAATAALLEARANHP